MGQSRATRVCQGCGHTLPLQYFVSISKALGRSGLCDVCRDKERHDRPWTAEQIDRLRSAGSGVMGLWSRYADLWDEDDLVRLRELCAALDRDNPNQPTGKRSNRDESVAVA